MLFMLVPWVLTIVALVFFFKWVLNQLSARQGGSLGESALDILKNATRGERSTKKSMRRKRKRLALAELSLPCSGGSLSDRFL